MQKFEGVFYHAGDFFCEIPAQPARLFKLLHGATELAEFGCAVPGDFSEETALTGKARLHRSHDGFTGALELNRTIPFGSEPEIRRVLEFSSAGVHFSADFTPKGQPFRRMVLEPVHFGKEWTEVSGFLLKDGKLTGFHFPHGGEARDLLCGTELIVWCEVGFADGCRAGFGCGNDLWRHNAASAMPDAQAEFRLTLRGDGSLLLNRTVFAFPKEAEVPVRPWRFKSVLFFSSAETAPVAGSGISPDWSTLPACLAAAPVRRALRDFLRRRQDDTVLELPGLTLCMDPAHLDRPNHGETAHWGVEEIFELYSQFGRKFAECGRNFAIRCADTAPESLRNALACPMQKLIWEDEK